MFTTQKNQWPAHLLHMSGFMRSIKKIFNLSTKLKYHNSQERDKGGCDLQCHKPQGGPWLHVLLYSLDKVINIIIIVSFVKLNLTINERYFEYEDLSDVLFHPEPELLWALGEIISASGNSLELSFWIHNSNEGRIANMDLKLSRESWLKYKALPNYKFYEKKLLWSSWWWCYWCFSCFILQ